MSEQRVLVVDDDAAVAQTTHMLLTQEGFQATSVSSAEAALRLLERSSFDLVLSDVRMPGMDGLELLSAIKARVPEVPVLIMTAYKDEGVAEKARLSGAANFLLKPVQRIELLFWVKKELGATEAARRAPPPRSPASRRAHGLLGESPAVREVRDHLGKLAGTDMRVLIRGEPGTGKELVARGIWSQSARAGAPFVAVNCASLNDNLYQSEFFGHTKGSHATAFADKAGLLEIAHGGTLFLDEIGDLSLTIQAGLLRFLQEGEFMRVGGTKTLKADVRVLSATNRPLEQMIAAKEFRQDFFDRIKKLTVQLPALRAHREDISLLANHFLASFAEDCGRKGAALRPAAVQALEAYGWPGNVRELQGCLERLVVFSNDPTAISEADVARDLGQAAGPPPDDVPPPESPRRKLDEAAVRDALGRAGNNRSQAARLLRISRRTLYNKINAYGIDAPDTAAPRGVT